MTDDLISCLVNATTVVRVVGHGPLICTESMQHMITDDPIGRENCDGCDAHLADLRHRAAGSAG